MPLLGKRSSTDGMAVAITSEVERQRLKTSLGSSQRTAGIQFLSKLVYLPKLLQQLARSLNCLLAIHTGY